MSYIKSCLKPKEKTHQLISKCDLPNIQLSSLSIWIAEKHIQPTCRTDWDDTWFLKKNRSNSPDRSDKKCLHLPNLSSNKLYSQHFARNLIHPIFISSRGCLVPPSQKYWVPAVVCLAAGQKDGGCRPGSSQEKQISSDTKTSLSHPTGSV